MKLADCVLEVETQSSEYESWSGVIETVARHKAHWESRRKDRKIERLGRRETVGNESARG